MNNVKENRKKWIAALRSGEYEQGVEYLCSDGKYCCLGVLCSVYERETGEKLPKAGSYYDVSEETLSELPQVQEWVGLRHYQGSFALSAPTPTHLLTALNDDFAEYDFNKIADLIESEPAGLFV